MEKVPYLEIHMAMNWVVLCPRHENELLQWLLANYIKRMSKKKPGIIPLAKSTTEGLVEWLKRDETAEDAEQLNFKDEADIPSAQERLNHDWE